MRFLARQNTNHSPWWYWVFGSPGGTYQRSSAQIFDLLRNGPGPLGDSMQSDLLPDLIIDTGKNFGIAGTNRKSALTEEKEREEKKKRGYSILLRSEERRVGKECRARM